MKDFALIAEEKLQIPRESIQDSLTPYDVPDWDSMNYLLFIAELEKEYNISFNMDEILSAGSIGDLKKLIRDKGIAL